MMDSFLDGVKPHPEYVKKVAQNRVRTLRLSLQRNTGESLYDNGRQRAFAYRCADGVVWWKTGALASAIDARFYIDMVVNYDLPMAHRRYFVERAREQRLR